MVPYQWKDLSSAINNLSNRPPQHLIAYNSPECRSICGTIKSTQSYVSVKFVHHTLFCHNLLWTPGSSTALEKPTFLWQFQFTDKFPGLLSNLIQLLSQRLISWSHLNDLWYFEYPLPYRDQSSWVHFRVGCPVISLKWCWLNKIS